MPPNQAIKEKANELYEKCSLNLPSTTYFQDDLLNLGVVQDVPELTKVCQQLLAEQLLQAFSQDGANCYRIRKREDAAKLLSMSSDERVIFNQIESTGTTGIWTKTIKARTNLHQTVITKCLKNLESKRLVKPVVSVRFPKRKIYMLHHLSPSEDVTGGLWFSDGELDVDLVETLAQVICTFVEKGSWKEVKDPTPAPADIQKKKEAVLAARQDQSKKKDAAAGQAHTNDGTDTHINPPGKDSDNDLFMTDAPSTISTNNTTSNNQTTGPFTTKSLSSLSSPRSTPRFRPKLRKNNCRLVPLPSSASDFPTAASILAFLEQTQIAQVALTDADLRTLLDMLVYDGRLERIGPLGYRTVMALDRPPEDGGPGNGLSEVPCGRCPVFNLCEVGGPVSAENCVYFEEWLGKGGRERW